MGHLNFLHTPALMPECTLFHIVHASQSFQEITFSTAVNDVVARVVRAFRKILKATDPLTECYTGEKLCYIYRSMK